MLQHVLLGDIAPVLLLLSLSRVILRPATRRLMGVERALGPLASPWTGIALWLGLMYLWHMPALYEAAIENPVVHLLEHASFFTAGVAVWWPLIQPVPDAPRRCRGLWPVAYIGTAKFGLAALGLYLTWSGTVLYDYYEGVPRIWGLSRHRRPERGRRDHDGRAVADVRDRARGAVRPHARPVRDGGAAAGAAGGPRLAG